MKHGTLLCLVVCALVAVSACAHAATIDVGLGGGYTYNTIQAGINAATNGDTVVVHDGVYTGTGNRDIDFGGRRITVRSANGAASTIVDCQRAGRGFYFHSLETSLSVLEGFTVRNGQGPTSGGEEVLGGTGGGGIYCTGSSPTIRGCVFSGNDGACGGGINANYGSNVLVTDCMFVGNTASDGAGFWGGSSEFSITGCIFLQNSARRCGGAIRTNTANTTITNCLIYNNTTPGWGGGIVFADGGAMSVLDCTIADNFISGGGAGVGGIAVCDTFNFFDATNCVLWGNANGQIYHDPVASPGPVTVTYTDAQASTGELWFDPLTCLDAYPLFTAGYHLLSGSPCVNTGTDVGVYVDLDGNVRPLLGGFDAWVEQGYPVEPHRGAAAQVAVFSDPGTSG